MRHVKMDARSLARPEEKKKEPGNAAYKTPHRYAVPKAKRDVTS